MRTFLPAIMTKLIKKRTVIMLNSTPTKSIKPQKILNVGTDTIELIQMENETQSVKMTIPWSSVLYIQEVSVKEKPSTEEPRKDVEKPSDSTKVQDTKAK